MGVMGAGEVRGSVVTGEVWGSVVTGERDS